VLKTHAKCDLINIVPDLLCQTGLRDHSRQKLAFSCPSKSKPKTRTCLIQTGAGFGLDLGRGKCSFTLKTDVVSDGTRHYTWRQGGGFSQRTWAQAYTHGKPSALAEKKAAEDAITSSNGLHCAQASWPRERGILYRVHRRRGQR
jgi:hypothetical protein